MRVKTELTFSTELKDEPLICNLCKKFDIVLNIVEASFSTATGWAILILEGAEEELKKSFEYLQSSGVKTERTEKIS